jgi:hypothetical protein
VNKVKVFLSYDNNTKLLFMESFFFLAWARILKSLPFTKVAPSLGEQMLETIYEPNTTNEKIVKHISQAISVTSRYTFWESKCLVQAIAAMKMLNRRKIDSTLYLGTAKDEKGRFIAHAWLRSGPYYLTGAEGMEKFTIVGYFAKKFGEGLQGVSYEK